VVRRPPLPAWHACAGERGQSGSNTRNIEETGILEKANQSRSCYLAFNQVRNRKNAQGNVGDLPQLDIGHVKFD
jgi:hypothetical protein